jgi:Kinesin-like protein
MLGNPDHERKKGIIPQALENIFQRAAQDKENTYQIRIAYIQIYMEMVWNFDFLLIINSYKILSSPLTQRSESEKVLKMVYS